MPKAILLLLWLICRNAVLDRIRSSEALKSGNVDSLRKLVDEIVLPATDFTMMTRMTVGPKWRTATAEQKKALESGFETLLLRVYAGGLTAVKDAKMMSCGRLE